MSDRKIDWAKSDGLIPAIVQDSANGRVLMLGYMNEAALAQTQASGFVTFFSRSRQEIWRKGETSGNVLRFKSMAVDCDGDTLLILAEPVGPTCHTGARSCFGEMDFALGFLPELETIIADRIQAGGEESYVARLLQKGVAKMAQKVGEEGVETALAAVLPSLGDFKNEAADLLFHLLILLRAKEASLQDIAHILRERHVGKEK